MLVRPLKENLATVGYWLDIAVKDLNLDIDIITDYIYNLLDYSYYIELDEVMGIAIWHIKNNIHGEKTAYNSVIYLDKNYRTIDSFRLLINSMEQAVKYQDCKYLVMGANSGYNDKKVINMLKRFGYETVNVKKKIGV